LSDIACASKPLFDISGGSSLTNVTELSDISLDANHENDRLLDEGSDEMFDGGTVSLLVEEPEGAVGEDNPLSQTPLLTHAMCNMSGLNVHTLTLDINQ
jgi:hypothetical protein